MISHHMYKRIADIMISMSSGWFGLVVIPVSRGLDLFVLVQYIVFGTVFFYMALLVEQINAHD